MTLRSGIALNLFVPENLLGQAIGGLTQQSYQSTRITPLIETPRA
jgi:hypothetical protein